MNETITPAVHLEFIQNQLDNTNSATEEIEQYHRALFLHHHAIEFEQSRQQAKLHADRLTFLEDQLKETERLLSERPRLVPVTVDGRADTEPTSPWNAWDLSMFILCALGIAALITFGILNISFNLLESGFITFRESPFRSYLWAALLPVGALAVKVGWDSLQERRRRDLYLWGCLALGLVGVLVWVGAYACVYPTLSKGINDQIASLTVFDSSPSSPAPVSRLNFAGAKWVDVITVAGQAIAEIFLSAVLGMYLTSVYARHRPVRLAHDPTFAQLDLERQSLEHKDHRASPGREYEFIEFESPVDVREVEAWVNFYKGSSPDGPRGEVRLEYRGRIYGATFSIRAPSGNRGRSGPSQQDFWTRIPVQEILKLTPRPPSG
jgi:hypothetical protein